MNEQPLTNEELTEAVRALQYEREALWERINRLEAQMNSVATHWHETTAQEPSFRKNSPLKVP